MLRTKILGVPRETKLHEYRVSMTPRGVKHFVDRGAHVLIGKGAGKGAGFHDEMYEKVGAIVCDNKDVFKLSELIVKVKEPQPEEYDLIQRDSIILGYFHLASSPELTHAMLKSNSISIAYETIRLSDNSLPLLKPMSEIAGLLAVQNGMKYLEKPLGGSGVLICGTQGTEPGNVCIIGGGIAGMHAAILSAKIGGNVYLFEKNELRINELVQLLKSFPQIQILQLDESDEKNMQNFQTVLSHADLTIGSIHTAGAQAKKLVTIEMIKQMKKGSVFCDISIDQGGCTEVSVPTSHSDPVFTSYGIQFYCVPNMPSSVSNTATEALSSVTMSYIAKLMEHGLYQACIRSPSLVSGINVFKGKMTNKSVANQFGYKYYDALHLLNMHDIMNA